MSNNAWVDNTVCFHCHYFFDLLMLGPDTIECRSHLCSWTTNPIACLHFCNSKILLKFFIFFYVNNHCTVKDHVSCKYIKLNFWLVICIAEKLNLTPLRLEHTQLMVSYWAVLVSICQASLFVVFHVSPLIGLTSTEVHPVQYLESAS